MSSRMDKYYNDNQSNLSTGSRTKKNEQLYHDISNSELDAINLTSNAHVIGDNDSLDVNKIKELIEKTYGSEPKKVSKPLDFSKEEPEEVDVEETTKEYDINAILKKARLDKNVDYERERLKKIHDTQYNILKNLDLDNNEDKKQESKVTSDKEGLMELIETITEKEMTREMQPLDLLSDLKGSENTVVLDGIKESNKNEELKLNIKKEKNDKGIDKNFYTNSLSFTQSDFDDFNDLKEDVESNKIIVRVLLVIVGIVFLVNSLFHLNLF